MRLLIALPFLAVGLVGCTNHVPCGTDPFFGRTTVAPPGTGSATASDPAYSSRGLATTAASPASPGASPPPSLFSPSTMPSSMPAIAMAPEARTPRPTSGGPVPLSNSSVPLNISPTVTAPINPVTATSKTTYTPYTPSGNAYAAGSSMGLTPVVRSAGTRSSSSASGLGPSGPGPKMTRTRVTPLSLSENPHNSSAGTAPASIAPANSTGAAPQARPRSNMLADNRARTFGQLGQVTIDNNGSARRATATSSAMAGPPSPGRNTKQPFSTPAAGAGSWTVPNRTGPNRTVPRRISPPDKVIDIMDLPPKGLGGFSSTGSAKASTAVHRDPAVRLASATTSQPPPGKQATNPYPRRLPESNKPISFTPSAKYGHADDHSWLKGRIEYSQARRRWKLRYIPIDGETDRFGGSVILRKTSLLSGYERGDCVEVKGRLADDAKTAGDYAPDYEITQIKRIGRDGP